MVVAVTILYLKSKDGHYTTEVIVLHFLTFPVLSCPLTSPGITLKLKCWIWCSLSLKGSFKSLQLC